MTQNTMHLNLNPCRMDTQLVADISGEVITLNGQQIDLSGVAEGIPSPATTFDCDWLTGEVARIDGVLHLTLVLPHGANAPQATLWPEPIAAGDGVVALPAYSSEPVTMVTG